MAAGEQALDRRVVADVRRDAEEHDLVRREALEQAVGVRVREDVEVLLQEQELAPAEPPLGHLGGAERHRVGLLGLGDLLGAARAAQAVRRERARVVGRLGDLRVGQLVVVGGRHVRNPLRTRPGDEPRHRRHHRLGAGHGELAVPVDEVDLRVDVPQHPLHVTGSSRGFGRSQRPTFADGSPSVTTMSAVKSFEPRISDEPMP
jgi:hypothetical protein